MEECCLEMAEVADIVETSGKFIVIGLLCSRMLHCAFSSSDEPFFGKDSFDLGHNDSSSSTESEDECDDRPKMRLTSYSLKTAALKLKPREEPKKEQEESSEAEGGDMGFGLFDDDDSSAAISLASVKKVGHFMLENKNMLEEAPLPIVTAPAITLDYEDNLFSGKI